MGGLRFVACRSALSSLSLSSCARIQLLNAQFSDFITQICAFTEGRFPAMVSRFACSSFSEEHEEVERSSERELEKRFARAAVARFSGPNHVFYSSSEISHLVCASKKRPCPKSAGISSLFFSSISLDDLCGLFKEHIAFEHLVHDSACVRFSLTRSVRLSFRSSKRLPMRVVSLLHVEISVLYDYSFSLNYGKRRG